MRKYACLAQLAALATQFEQWTERERDRGETCRIQQTYVDVRTHFKQWYELYKLLFGVEMRKHFKWNIFDFVSFKPFLHTCTYT